MAGLQLVAQSLLLVLGAGALKATLVLAVAMVAAWALRRGSAALRNLVWLAALSACVAVLILPMVTPTWRVAPLPVVGGSLVLPGAEGWISAAELADQRSEDVWSLTPSHRVAGSGGASGSSPGGWTLPAWPILLAGLWGLGAALVLARQVVSLLLLRRLRRQGRPLAAPASTVARRLVIEMQVRAQVVACDDLTPPLAFGVFSPCILLPATAEGWSVGRLEHVLRHELAHVRRKDAQAQWLASLACAALWFHPLVWHAAHRLREERELACDDMVLGGGSRPSAYAEDLLALAAHSGRAPGAAAMTMAGPSRIERRLRALLAPGGDRRVPSRGTAWAVLGLSLAAAAPVAAMRSLPAPSVLPVRTASVLLAAATTATPRPASQPAAPAVGGEGRIAVTLQRAGKWDVYGVSPDGSGLRRLTNTSTASRFPVWSPDGSKLLFGTDELAQSGNDWTQGWSISVMRADGSGVTPLFPKVAAKAARVWSPDGTRIAFETTRDGDREIYTVGADGTGLTRLTSSPGDDGSPSWSPDGSRIAFVSARDGDKEIYVVSARGGQARRLTVHAGDDEEPNWSPDGASIALISAENGQDQIAVMAADGSNLTRLTSDATAKHEIHWSPNGGMILFQSVRGDNYDVERIQANGAGRVRLTSAPGYDGQAGFSPDGRQVVMVSDDSENLSGSTTQSSVYVVSVDGGPARRVVVGPALDPDWTR